MTRRWRWRSRPRCMRARHDDASRSIPGLIRAAAEPLPDLDDPGVRTHVRPLRRRARGAARRGQPRHVGVLSRARCDHAPAGAGARLPHRRGRGRLAGRGEHRPLRPPSAGVGSAGAGLPALPDLDVAQCGGRRVRRLVAGVQPVAAAGPARRLPRAGPLQPQHLDPRGARLPRPRGSRSGRGGPSRATVA